MAGLQKPISGLPSSSTFATADILPIVKSGNTDFITGGNFRTALFGIAQADPLSIGALTAVGNSTITGTLSGITTFTATTGVFTTLSTSSSAVVGGGLTVTSGGMTVQSGGTTLSGGLIVTGGFTMTTAVSKLVPGATSFSVRNNADSTDNLIIFDNGNIAVRGALTLVPAVSKIVPGATSFSHRNNADTQDNLIITDSGNVSVRGSLSLLNTLVMTAAVSKIIPGATSWSVRDSADSADRLLLNASGFTVLNTLITAASLTGAAGLNIPHGTAPSSPVNGDMWTTTGGAFIRINGVTKTFTLT